VFVILARDVAPELTGPAGGTLEGARVHEGQILSGLAHGAGHIVVVVTGDVLILGPVQVRVIFR